MHKNLKKRDKIPEKPKKMLTFFLLYGIITSNSKKGIDGEYFLQGNSKES